jgi:lipopolysaccharide transport system ATP-binding protein
MTSEPAIRVEQIGKRYKIGLRDDARRSFGEALLHAGGAPLRRLRHLSEGSDGSDLFWALRDISFDVARGEVIGIIGRNGAGKSTLLKILSRITEPTEGTARLRGRVASLLEVGTGFHPELTGRENIQLNGAILGMKKAEIARKFDEIVAFAEIGRFLDTPVKRYSSGMRVRLGFAVAAHLEPEILIVDEVLAVGDVAFQQKCLGKMNDVAHSGRTILFVSHNMASIESLCDRVILLEQGAIKRIGACGAVIDDYLSHLAERSLHAIGERDDREGDGSARCTGLWFEDELGTVTDTFRSGQDLRVCLRYELARLNARFDFNVGVYDRSGTCLAHNGTGYACRSSEPPPRAGVMVCEIRKLPLPPGVYYLNTSIVRDGAGRADRVERAARFTVESGDFYGSGRIPPAGSGKVLMDYVWDVREAGADKSHDLITAENAGSAE